MHHIIGSYFFFFFFLLLYRLLSPGLQSFGENSAHILVVSLLYMMSEFSFVAFKTLLVYTFDNFIVMSLLLKSLTYLESLGAHESGHTFLLSSLGSFQSLLL